jgi:two-component system, chemotaxis family, response regulator Rcp1
VVDRTVDDMPVQVLLIEDNTADVRLMREVLFGINNEVKLLVASNGIEALILLRQQSTGINSSRPDLILLDLHLPKMDGHEFLAYMKADASLASIPVIVLTSSDSEADRVKSYHLNASCFVKKPGQLDEFTMLMKSLNGFWLTKVRYPRQVMEGEVELVS